jgi:hypothetical protein
MQEDEEGISLWSTEHDGRSAQMTPTSRVWTFQTNFPLPSIGRDTPVFVYRDNIIFNIPKDISAVMGVYIG